jgi:hypothetical protein
MSIVIAMKAAQGFAQHPLRAACARQRGVKHADQLVKKFPVERPPKALRAIESVANRANRREVIRDRRKDNGRRKTESGRQTTPDEG